MFTGADELGCFCTTVPITRTFVRVGEVDPRQKKVPGGGGAGRVVGVGRDGQ